MILNLMKEILRARYLRDLDLNLQERDEVKKGNVNNEVEKSVESNPEKSTLPSDTTEDSKESNPNPSRIQDVPGGKSERAIQKL